VTAQTLTVERRAVLRRRVRTVVAITITWNVIEAVVALIAGGIASSAALIGFGLDSVVEVLSAAAVAWQFAAPDPEKREKTALRVIALSFFGPPPTSLSTRSCRWRGCATRSTPRSGS
jgi:hypothetical protein